MSPSKVVIVILSITAIQAEQDGVYFKIEENTFLSHENAIWNEKAASLLSCSLTCARQDICKSANFLTDNQACLTFKETSARNIDMLLPQEESFYIEKIISERRSTLLGTTQSSAVPSCQSLRNQSPSTPSGVYWIDPDDGSQDNAFKVYCDMETDGGGWTLVWSYTFTNYLNFSHASNAITPRPNWPVKKKVDILVSTTPPLNETDYNAIEFSLWKQLGRQVLIKSNINNWLICHPVTGGLVEWQFGNVNCHVIRRVTATCNGKSGPSRFSRIQGYGPRFYSSAWNSPYYYFDGYTGEDWPTHDPCGRGQPNHLKHVADPHGNIYIR